MALPAARPPCESVPGGGVFPWLNANVNAPVPQDGAGADQVGRPVPDVYAVSRPQPLDGVIMISLNGAATPAVANHSAAAHAARTKVMARVPVRLIAFS
ncbi:hypothetical protein B4Q13_24255, partial [Lacticaseibacillus rhamnosus]